MIEHNSNGEEFKLQFMRNKSTERNQEEKPGRYSGSFIKTVSNCRNLFIFTILFVLVSCAENEPPLAPKGLLCELLSNPREAVITDDQPEFGWIVNDPRRGAMQSAYQILVSSNKSKIQGDQGDFWDSGKINSGQSINITYNGKSLNPNTAYWWKVRTWDNDDEVSAYSEPQQINTGDFNFTDRTWPTESRWIKLKKESGNHWVFENRHRSSFKEIEPVEVIEKSEGHYVIEFEKAAFATLKLTLTSETAGDTVKIHLGEKRKADKTVDRNPGGSIVYKTTHLILRKGTHDYLVALPRQHSNYPNSQVLPDHIPEVTSFRYAEIVGSPSKLEKADILQYALFYQFDDEASFFTSSNEDLNAVWDISKYTLKATPFLGVYADGTRERMPYEADAYIQQISHYAVDREYAIGRYTHEFLIFNPSWPTEWHLHSVLMAWADYIQTEDTESLKRYYEHLRAKTLLALAREDGLISTRTGLVTEDVLESIHYEGESFRDIVDWPQGTPFGEEENKSGFNTNLAGETDRYVFTDINTVVNAFHYRNLVLMSKIAKVIEKEEDAVFFRNRAEKVKKAFNNILFDKARGIYVDGEGTNHAALHANMFPLAFGLVPEKYHQSVVEFIKSRGMAASPYGAQYLLEALYKAGASQYALDLMTSDSDRSWLNMIRVGSTMTTEAWDIKYKSNLGWNHAWGASPANIIANKLMGIEHLEPSFRKIQIKPQPGNLEWAKIKMPTIRGTVYVNFLNNFQDDTFSLYLQIPANTTAKVFLPRKEQDDYIVTLNGEEVDAFSEGQFMVVDSVQSGKSIIEYKKKND